jgi:hypothetical protein
MAENILPPKSNSLGGLTSPPRSTGNPSTDFPLILNWLQQFANYSLAVNEYLRQQIVAVDFDPNLLPDPENSTISAAQTTANQAYTLADTALDNAATAQAAADAADVTANTALSNAAAASTAATNAQTTANLANNRTKDWLRGQLTITGAATSATNTFAPVQGDTSYFVFPAIESSTGAPAAGAYTVTSIGKTVNDFTLNVLAAPGIGNSVTYNWILVRGI